MALGDDYYESGLDIKGVYVRKNAKTATEQTRTGVLCVVWS